MDNWIYGSSIMDVDRCEMPFQFNHFHIIVEGLRWCLRNPFPSILYHISVLKGISSAQALLLLPLVAPMVAGQLSSFEQLRQAWLGSVFMSSELDCA